jgi:3-dehydroquinate synthase
VTHRVRVDLGPRGYDVLVAEGAAAELPRVLAGRRRVAVVTQDAVARATDDLVGRVLDQAGVDHRVFTIGDGEAAKTLPTVERLCRDLAVWGLLRGDAVVAAGGGVVGDTAGFAAAVYHRGVALVQVPTTLLAMVDAAIGGKTGVNLPEGKNLLGAFHQPLAVLADPSTLAALPAREYRCGLGEVAKYELMGERVLGGDAAALVAREPSAVTAVVARCAAVKARYVEADEEERTGVRAALNYGHTLAHALEVATDHELPHGEAVAVGLVFAGHLAAALGRVPPETAAAHAETVASLGLPVRAPAGLRAEDLLAIMARDKKSAGALTFVLPGAGGLERVDDPDPGAIGEALAVVGVEG